MFLFFFYRGHLATTPPSWAHLYRCNSHFFLSSDKKKEKKRTQPHRKESKPTKYANTPFDVTSSFFFCFFSKQIFSFSGFLMIFKSDRRQRCFGEREQKEKQRMTQKWEEKTSKTEPESCTGKKKTLSNVCNALSLSLSLSISLSLHFSPSYLDGSYLVFNQFENGISNQRNRRHSSQHANQVENFVSSSSPSLFCSSAMFFCSSLFLFVFF